MIKGLFGWATGAKIRIRIAEVNITIIDVIGVYLNGYKFTPIINNKWLIKNKRWHLRYVLAWYPPAVFLTIKNERKKSKEYTIESVIKDKTTNTVKYTIVDRSISNPYSYISAFASSIICFLVKYLATF